MFFAWQSRHMILMFSLMCGFFSSSLLCMCQKLQQNKIVLVILVLFIYFVFICVYIFPCLSLSVCVCVCVSECFFPSLFDYFELTPRFRELHKKGRANIQYICMYLYILLYIKET